MKKKFSFKLFFCKLINGALITVFALIDAQCANAKAGCASIKCLKFINSIIWYKELWLKNININCFCVFVLQP